MRKPVVAVVTGLACLSFAGHAQASGMIADVSATLDAQVSVRGEALLPKLSVQVACDPASLAAATEGEADPGFLLCGAHVGSVEVKGRTTYGTDHLFGGVKSSGHTSTTTAAGRTIELPRIDCDDDLDHLLVTATGLAGGSSKTVKVDLPGNGCKTLRAPVSRSQALKSAKTAFNRSHREGQKAFRRSSYVCKRNGNQWRCTRTIDISSAEGKAFLCWRVNVRGERQEVFGRRSAATAKATGLTKARVVMAKSRCR